MTRILGNGPRSILILLLGAGAHTYGLDAQAPDVDSLPGREYVLKLQDDEGRRGVAVLPATYSEAGPVEILDPSSFRLIMTDADDPGKEIAYPAGELIDPPVGRFRVWLEGKWSITPFTDLVSFGARRPPRKKSLKLLPVIPAGLVTLAAQQPVPPGLQLRLLYAGADSVAGGLRHELSRRKLVGELGNGILMPEGPVLAALWDGRQGRYIALSRPFDVVPGRSVAAPLEDPSPAGARLVVYVDRPKGAPASAIPGLELVATQQGQRHAPDLVVMTSWGVYAVWYDLKPGSAVVQAGNQGLYLAPVNVQLPRGKISRFQSSLTQRLFAEGELEAP